MNTTPITLSRFSVYSLIAVISFSLGTDYLVYGTIYPLTTLSPAGIKSDEQLCILGGCYAVGVLITTPLFGYFGDRLGYRRPMILGSMILGAATILVALAPNLVIMALGRVIQGAAAGITWTAGLAIIAENYHTRRVEMMGYAFMGSTAGSVAGPALAGWLYSVGGYHLPFIVVLGIIGLNILLLLAFLPKDTHLDSTAPDYRALLFDPAVLAPSFSVILAAAAWGIIEPVAPLLLSKGGATPGKIGVILTCTTLVYGFCSPFVSKAVNRIGSTMTMRVGIVGLALTVPLAGLVGGVLAVTLSLCAINIMYALTLNPASAAMGDAVEARGLTCYNAVFAIYSIVYSFGQIGSSILAAVVLEHTDLLIALFGFSALLIFSIPLMLKMTRTAAAK